MEKWIVVRGGGDLATGTIHKLYRSGFQVLVLEAKEPSAIRRNVAFSEAVYEGMKTVEGVTAYLAKDYAHAREMMENGKLPVLIDPKGDCLNKEKPWALVDAILAKKNLGTTRKMAEHTIALGPGFYAGKDVDCVIETKRGHHLGRLIFEGEAIANTGIPGVIAGFGKERVIHAPAEGIVRNVAHITDTVAKNQVIAVIEGKNESVPVPATLDGILRGLIRDGYFVKKGFKMADIDPRMQEYENCFTISDKARCIAGGVLEALLYLDNNRRSEI